MLYGILYTFIGFLVGLFIGKKGLPRFQTLVPAKERVCVTAEEREILLK